MRNYVSDYDISWDLNSIYSYRRTIISFPFPLWRSIAISINQIWRKEKFWRTDPIGFHQQELFPIWPSFYIEPPSHIKCARGIKEILRLTDDKESVLEVAWRGVVEIDAATVVTGVLSSHIADLETSGLESGSRRRGCRHQLLMSSSATPRFPWK